MRLTIILSLVFFALGMAVTGVIHGFDIDTEPYQHNAPPVNPPPVTVISQGTTGTGALGGAEQYISPGLGALQPSGPPNNHATDLTSDGVEHLRWARVTTDPAVATQGTAHQEVEYHVERRLRIRISNHATPVPPSYTVVVEETNHIFMSISFLFDDSMEQVNGQGSVTITGESVAGTTVGPYAFIAAENPTGGPSPQLVVQDDDDLVTHPAAFFTFFTQGTGTVVANLEAEATILIDVDIDESESPLFGTNADHTVFGYGEYHTDYDITVWED